MSFQTWGEFLVGKFHRQDREETLNLARSGKLEIVLTTFETARDHVDDLNRVNWTMVIVDEVHKIKEHSSLVIFSLFLFFNAFLSVDSVAQW